MSDQPEQEQDEQEQPDTSAATENTAPGDEDFRIPKTRFDQVNDERKQALQKMAELERKEQEREQALKLEKGQHQEVITELQQEVAQLKSQLDSLEGARDALQKSVEARIDALPEDWRDAVPEFDDPAKTLEWLDKAGPKLTRPTPPNTNAGAMGDKSPLSNIKLTPEQQQMARRVGMTDDQFAKQLKRFRERE